MQRLSFGIKTAAVIYHKTIENVLSDIPDVAVHQDDIIVTGKHLADHIKNLKIVLSRLRSVGLKIRADKCSFFQDQDLTKVLP